MQFNKKIQVEIYLAILLLYQIINNVTLRILNMNKKIKDKYELHAQVLKALSHSTRLFIVNELAQHEKCVCELQELIEDDISTISKHLSILKQAGIIEDRKEGLRVYYRLRLKCLPMFLSCVENIIIEKTKMQFEILNLSSEK